MFCVYYVLNSYVIVIIVRVLGVYVHPFIVLILSIVIPVYITFAFHYPKGIKGLMGFIERFRMWMRKKILRIKEIVGRYVRGK